MLFECDCVDFMKELKDNEVDFTLTDIPYDAVNRTSNGLRNLDKDKADIITFDLNIFLEQVYRVTKNSLCIFCSKEQFSEIYAFFSKKKGTVRPIVWEKSNPSPMNGQYIYLSGVELAVWFKKSGAKTFNAHCKNTVFKFPNGKRTFHPTQKNLALFEELLLDNSNENDTVFDPCMGSGTTAIAAIKHNRKWVGCELFSEYYIKAGDRIKSSYNTTEEELRVTKDWLHNLSVNYVSVKKSIHANNEDIVVILPSGKQVTVEVKQDELWRFSKWHEYGVDMISMFQFKDGMFWDTKVHKFTELQAFLSTVNQDDPSFKWGKIIYSQADIWLFYTKNPDGSYYNLEGYDMNKMKQDIDLPNFIGQQCSFARNSKRKDDVSGDIFNSATFFVPVILLEPWRITKEAFMF